MTKKSKEDAATSARRKAGARELGVLEGKLARKKKGRVPGADLGTKAKKGSLGRIGAAAHKDIPTTTAKEKEAAAGITAGMLLAGPALKVVGKAFDIAEDIAGQGTYHDYFQGKTLPARKYSAPRKRGVKSLKLSGKPPAKVSKNMITKSKDTKVSKNMITKSKDTKVSKNMITKAKDTKVSKNKLGKAKGGPVKKYAKGGGVRKAR
jgi:hypothetical protein